MHTHTHIRQVASPRFPSCLMCAQQIPQISDPRGDSSALQRSQHTNPPLLLLPEPLSPSLPVRGRLMAARSFFCVTLMPRLCGSVCYIWITKIGHLVDWVIVTHGFYFTVSVTSNIPLLRVPQVLTSAFFLDQDVVISFVISIRLQKTKAKDRDFC